MCSPNRQVGAKVSLENAGGHPTLLSLTATCAQGLVRLLPALLSSFTLDATSSGNLAVTLIVTSFFHRLLEHPDCSAQPSYLW